jgi:hypothetical protein
MRTSLYNSRTGRCSATRRSLDAPALFGFLSTMDRSNLSRPVVILGLAGILPQAFCLLIAMFSVSYQSVGLAAGCFYAAIILSFLGGLWWMAGLLSGETRTWIYVLAIGPSLAGWTALLPMVSGWPWPRPSLVALALILLASPMVDLAISRHITFPRGWLRLRVAMATGLGSLTLAMAAF